MIELPWKYISIISTGNRFSYVKRFIIEFKLNTHIIDYSYLKLPSVLYSKAVFPGF